MDTYSEAAKDAAYQSVAIGTGSKESSKKEREHSWPRYGTGPCPSLHVGDLAMMMQKASPHPV